MSVKEYETRLHELSRHAEMILPTEEERVRCFVRGLRLQLRLETQSLVSAGRSFLDVVDHASTMEHLRREAHGSAKRGLGMRAATVTPAHCLEIIMTGPDDGFDRVSLADLHRPLFRHQMVVGVRLVLVRAARCFSRVLQAMVVVLL